MRDPRDPTDQYSIEAFASHQFYHDMNALLVRLVIDRLTAERPDARQLDVLEIASGTGAATQVILDEFARHGYDISVTCIEPSRTAIAHAQRRLHGHRIRFVESTADRLPDAAHTPDVVFCCNAIHLIANKAQFAAEVARLLNPGGLLAVNTTYFEGAIAAGTERLNRLWLLHAYRWLRRHHPESRPQRSSAAPSLEWLPASQYAALFDEHGLHPVRCQLEEVLLTVTAVQAIAQYELFIAAALPGIPIRLGAEALVQGAAEAARELNVTVIPRTWLHVLTERVPISS